MPMVYELGLKLGLKTISNSSMILQYLMARKVGGTSAHGHKKVNKSHTYTPPAKTNTSKHPKVYRPAPTHTTTRATPNNPAVTTGSHGASYGVTRTAPERVIQQKQRTNTVNTIHKLKHPKTVAKEIIAPAYNLYKVAPPSVQAAVHTTVATVNRGLAGVLNQPAHAGSNTQFSQQPQKGVYYGTNPATGETQRFDTGGRALDAQTRQALTQQGWTITSTPPKGNQNWQFRNVGNQGTGGWVNTDSGVPW